MRCLAPPAHSARSQATCSRPWASGAVGGRQPALASMPSGVNGLRAPRAVTSPASSATQKQLQQRRGRRALAVAAMLPSNSPFPFEEAQYHRVQFVEEPYGPMKIFKDPRDQAQFTGVMVFRRATDCGLFKVMEVFVTGDTAINIYTLLNNLTLDRPMVHDVMFWIVQQAQSTDPRRWGLLRVAIVGLKDDVFVARLFFGDPVTQEVTWDCDCRPSDACFLSIKLNAPLFIARSVWDSAAKRLEKSSVHKMVTQQILLTDAPAQPATEQTSAQSVALPQAPAPAPAPQPTAQQQPPQQSSPGQNQPGSPAGQPMVRAQHATCTSSPVALPADADYTMLLHDDLDPIKLLKRELAVAIREEDYATAARIRDHPFMRTYRDMWINRLLGQQGDAERIELELRQLIEKST